MNKRFLTVISTILLCLAFSLTAFAGYTEKNDNTGFFALVEDDADLLTDEEEVQLVKDMYPITEYGCVVFKSITENPGTPLEYAGNYFLRNIGNDVSGTVFLFDMDNRKIFIASDGAIYDVITDTHADTIMDNTYKLASSGDYYGCAKETFYEIETLLRGEKIAQPMKYIGNALLALTFALLINYFIVKAFSKLKPASAESRISGSEKKFNAAKSMTVTYVGQTKRYDPVDSGGGGFIGGSGGGGGFSGGGGGGGFSGGGGGHSF